MRAQDVEEIWTSPASPETVVRPSGDAAQYGSDTAAGTHETHIAAIDARTPAAMTALGIMYEEGVGVVADDRQALRWYLTAAALGDGEAMNRLGSMYFVGRGVRQDFDAAGAWYEQAAAWGSQGALNNLATLYLYGLGVPRSRSRAVDLLTTLAANGDAAALARLGAVLEDGLGHVPGRDIRNPISICH